MSSYRGVPRKAAHFGISGPRAHCLACDLLDQRQAQSRRGRGLAERFARECQVEQLARFAEERSDVGNDVRVDAGQIDRDGSDDNRQHLVVPFELPDSPTKLFDFGPQALNLRFEWGVPPPHVSDERRLGSLRAAVVYHPLHPSSPRCFAPNSCNASRLPTLRGCAIFLNDRGFVYTADVGVVPGVVESNPTEICALVRILSLPRRRRTLHLTVPCFPDP